MSARAIHKKTKIVATIGPASEGEATLQSMMEAGLDVVRLNFSHGDHVEQGNRVIRVRRVAKRIGRDIAILQDLCGPKIRLGDFSTPTITLIPGEQFTLTTKECVGDVTRSFISYKYLPKEVKPGDPIMLNDGKQRLVVESIKGTDVVCRVEVGGEMKGRRGVNIPTGCQSIDCLTEKDRFDVTFGLKHKVDFFALSFVRKASDVHELRTILNTAKSTAGIIAKIETPQAVKDIDAIIEASDGIMVARGDLAVEMSPEQVPIIQKMIIKKCNCAGKPVITATQMLESMTRATIPTRAEVSDVANAILDGTDAVMLSEETAVGVNPLEVIKVMARVAGHVEGDLLHRELLTRRRASQGISGVVTDAVTSSAVHAAEAVGAHAIVALTLTGSTARMLSRHKPYQSVIALSPSDVVCRKLALSFAIRPMHIKKPKRLDDALEIVRRHFIKQGIGKSGESVVVVSGQPFGKAVGTNTILVERL
jgi:pyruvate kinase